MKKISTLFLLLSLAAVTSKAQLKVPMQYDTLVIKSMEYHFDEIRPENWPFSYVVRTPSSFIFGDQEFKIESSNNLPFEKIFRFESGDYETQVLSLQDYSENITIDFAGYFLVCEKTATTVETSDTTTSVKPYAKLKGRTVQAGLAKPKYNSQEGGTVVVSIWVDQYGNVTKAIAGTDGTTVSDKALWAAARTAAMETRFNMDGDAPVLQEGTITYYFGQFGQIEDVEDVWSRLEERPSFNGGDANEFSKWVNEHLVYPEQAKEHGVQGCVMLQYTVDTDGKVTDVSVLRGVDPSLDKEAVRVVSTSPKWKPGKLDGKPVEVTYTFPVIFRLY